MRNIILIISANSCEKDISVITSIFAYNAIKYDYNIYLICEKYDSFYIINNITKNGKIVNFLNHLKHEVFFSRGALHLNSFTKKEIYCALICNHGGSGENGSLQGYLESVGIPYTSSDVFTSALFMDKVITKEFVGRFADVLSYIQVEPNVCLEDLTSELVFPVIIKPARLGSSIGIGIAHNFDELKEKVDFAFKFDNKVIIEKALENFLEYNCAAIRYKGEIIISDIDNPMFNGEYYDFESKYLLTKEENGIKKDIDPILCQRIRNITREIYEKSGARGVIRVDFLYDGRLYVNEVNSIPGSLSFYLFKNQGISMHKLINMMIEEAVSDFKDRKNLISNYNSCLLENFSFDELLGSKK